MYIKGASRRSVGFWTKHLQNLEENIRAEIVEKRGVMSDDLREMMLEMREDARLTRCQNFMYIAAFNPCPHEVLTEKQWDDALQIFEQERGIPEGQARIVIEHEKEGRIHRHVVWNRIDLENCRAFDDGLNPDVCDRAKQRIEKELGLTVTATLKQPKRGVTEAYKSYEMFRGMESGLDPRDITAEITAIFRDSTNGADFIEGLRQHGYELVQGRRAFCVLDPAGQEHSLARRIEGVNTKELRDFMQGVDLSGIRSVEEAKLAFRDRHIERLEADHDTVRAEIEWNERVARAAIEKEKTEGRYEDREHEEQIANARAAWVGGSRNETDGPEQQERERRAREQADNKARAEQKRSTRAQIALAYALAHDGLEFADALEDRGFILAWVSEADAARLNKWERRRLQELDDLEQDLGAKHGSDKTGSRVPPGKTRADAWFSQMGGLDELSADLREKAEASYEAWKYNHRYGLADYVDYVQRNEAKRREIAGAAENEKEYERYHAGELVVVDPRSDVYELNLRNTGGNKEQLEARLVDIERNELLTVAAAQSVMAEVNSTRRLEKEHQRRQEWLDKQPLSETAGEIRLAYALTSGGQAFQDAIEDRGFILAEVTKYDAERLNRWEQRRREELGRHESFEGYRAGEFVVVNARADVFRLTEHTTGVHSSEREERLRDIDRRRLLSVSAAQTVMREARSQAKQEIREQREQGRRDAQHKRAEQLWPTLPSQTLNFKAGAPIHQMPFAADEATRPKAGPARAHNLTDALQHIYEAWQGSKSADSFAAALQGEGVHLAEVTPDEAHRSHMDASFAREVGRFSPRYDTGEIVAIVEPGMTYGEDGKLREPRVYRLNPRTTGDTQSQIDTFLKSLDRSQLQGLGATREQARAKAEERIVDLQTFRDLLQEVKADERLKWAQRTGKEPSARGTLTQTFGDALRTGGIATTAIGDMLETGVSTAGFIFNLIDPQKTPAQLRQEAINAEIEREKQADEQINWSNYTGVRAKQLENLENERAHRERRRQQEWELDRDR